MGKCTWCFKSILTETCPIINLRSKLFKEKFLRLTKIVYYIPTYAQISTVN